MKGRILLFFLTITFSTVAQFNYEANFKRIGEDFGLSNNWVRDIFQDKEGFIWFGTTDGLNRFDGYECKVYRPESEDGVSFGGIFINDVEAKNDDQLWVATHTGVYVFSENKLKRYSVLPSTGYDEIVKQDEEITWFTGAFGLIKYNIKTEEFENISKVESHITHNKKIKTTYKDTKGNIWFGSTGCIFKYNIKDESFLKIDQFQGIDKATTNDIITISEDKEGKIWAGFGQNGLYYYQPETNTNIFIKYSDGAIINSIVDKDNMLWVAKGSGEGLMSIDLNTGEEKVYRYDITNPNSISDSSIFSLLEDNAGDLWIGTFSSGVNYYSKRSKKIITIQQGKGKGNLKNNLVNAIEEDDRYMWIGTEGGLDRIHKKTNNFKHYSYQVGNIKSLRRNPVQSLCIDSKNTLWVGAWDGGIQKYNRNTDNFKRYSCIDEKQNIKSDNVVEIKQDLKNRLWVGTSGGGLFKFNYEKDELESFFKSEENPKGIPFKNIIQIHNYNQEEILLSTYKALIVFNPSNNKYTSFNLGNQLNISPANILCSYIDSKEKIWIGSNVGLYQLNIVTKEFVPYNLGGVLDSLSVQAIIEDQQKNIWFTTNGGIISLNRASNKINRITKQDGLTTNDFKRQSVFMDSSGMLHFGSSKGLNSLKPENITQNNKAPNLAITSLAVLKSQPNKNNDYEYVLENLSTDKEITLTNEQSSFVISFTGLNYLNPKKNTYKYKLEGYDKVWVDAKNERTATYTNLKAGEYTFKVTGLNSDGIESSEIKKISIVKKGPWYLSDWFKAVLGIILVSLPFVFYFIRLSIFKKQRKKLRIKVSERTKELTEANKLLTKQTSRIQKQNKELSNHRNNLEDLVTKRTKELEKAKVKAEESDRLKTAFIANMSHEIRTPMNAIYGFSGLLEDESVTVNERNEYIEIIKSSCESLLVLIDDILGISIMDAQGIELNIQEVNIDDFLKQIEIILKKEAREGVPLFFERGNESNITLKTDPIRLRQILVNLINNAIKFTEEGSVVFGYTKKEDYIQFYVKDTGIGISEKDLSNIFKPFIKAGNNASKIYRGTGIGLSISQRIVTTFKGKIWVESELGKGATFYINLPM